MMEPSDDLDTQAFSTGLEQFQDLAIRRQACKDGDAINEGQNTNICVVELVAPSATGPKTSSYPPS